MRLVPPGGRAAKARTKTRNPVRTASGAAAVMSGVLLLVTGCHVPGTSSTAAVPASTSTVTVAASPQVGDAPLYMAINDGYFSSAGLHVRVASYSSFKAERIALSQGKADIAFGSYADIFYSQGEAKAFKQGPKLSVIAEGYDAGPGVMEVLTLPNSRITSPSDLAGKAVGTAQPQVLPYQHAGSAKGQPYSLATVAVHSVLSNDNVDPKSVKWRPMPTQDLVSALHSGRVQAILATEPTIYQAESTLGAVPVLDACTGETANMPLEGYFSLQTYAAGHSAAVAAFRSALSRAQAAAAQAASVQKVLETDAKMPAQTASLLALGVYPTSISVNALQRIERLMFAYSVIHPSEQISVAAMIAH